MEPLFSVRPSIGDRVCLNGGYDFEPQWLGGKSQVQGTITDFIPGQNDTPAIIVRLDAPISMDDVSGEIVILELRYEREEWRDRNTVHVEVCDFVPEPMAWQFRRQGRWVESHATFQLLQNDKP
jgi:hypothetical protein